MLEICDELDEEDAAAIGQTQTLFNESAVFGLVAIVSNFSEIPATIQALEEHGLSPEDSTKRIDDLREKLRRLPAELGDISTKFEKVFGGNVGFKELCSIRDTMRGIVTEGSLTIPVEDSLLMKFAPIVSCEVERSFSQYKSILRDNRQSFLFENLKKYVIVACNKHLH